MAAKKPSKPAAKKGASKTPAKGTSKAKPAAKKPASKPTVKKTAKPAPRVAPKPKPKAKPVVKKPVPKKAPAKPVKVAAKPIKAAAKPVAKPKVAAKPAVKAAPKVVPVAKKAPTPSAKTKPVAVKATTVVPIKAPAKGAVVKAPATVQKAPALPPKVIAIGQVRKGSKAKQDPRAARKGYMNDTQKLHFRKKLLEWKSSLMQEVDRTVTHMKDEATNFPDPIDRAAQEEEFSLELRARDRERKLIKKIDSTLDLIDNDDYGYCEQCGVEIGVKRLEVRPTATMCIDCKELSEIKEKQLNG